MKNIKKYIKRKTKVYSLEFGVGEVIGVLKLYDGIEDYIEVKFLDAEHGTKVFSHKFQADLRIISNPMELKFVLENLHQKILETDYTKVTSAYRRIGVDMDLELLVNIIARLIGRIDLKKSDKLLLTRCMDSLILEVGHVFKINNSHARGMVSDYMKVA